MIIDNVIFEKGNPGRKDGIRIVPEGCEFKETEMRLFLNWDRTKMLGFVRLRLENGLILGRVNIAPSRYKLLNLPTKLYPSIGFVTIKQKGNEILSSVIWDVALTSYENEDETIPAIELP